MTVLIGLFISAIYQGAYFVKLWKASVIQAEQLKTANVSAKYEALNAQINPHFLFNSLNVLSNLVRTSPEAAESFIQGLSSVYRYVLDVRHDSLVPLARELEALRAFGELLATRFGERLQLDIRLSPPQQARDAGTKPAGQVVPLALQMLVENAVKHNGATRRYPLHVEIFAADGHICVRNNRVPLYEPAEGKGIGLANIRERYAMAANADIAVIDNPKHFEVRLPLLATDNP